MAKGGNSSTLEGGSEALFDHECTQCRARGSKQEATEFCQDCKQFLCNICGRYHVHYISCSDVKDIEIVAHKSNMSTLQSLEAEITRVSKLLHTTKLEIRNMKNSLLEEIKGLRKQFNIQLDALEQKIMAELEEEQNKLEMEIGDDITAVDDLINASDQSKPDLTSHFDEKHIFIAEKMGRVVLANVNTVLKKANVLKHPTLIFEPNDILCDAIEISDRMGKINRMDTKHNIIQRNNNTMESMNEIIVRVSSDKNICIIYDMFQLPDGTILLIDFNNKKLRRLDDQLNVKDFFDLKAKPRGLCSVSSTEVAVRLGNKTIHFIYVGKSLTYQRNDSINNFCNVMYGMACCNNQLWIPGTKDVHVYSLSGSLVKTIETDSQGGTIFSKFSPSNKAVSNDDTKVYVAAGDDRVVVFNNNGDVIKELRDQRLDGTLGICVTDDDIVLVAGYTSKNVVMFDRDGNSLGDFVSSKDMLYAPCSLCYDRRRCRLLVCYESDKAQLFQLS